ncbi:hypothetical protein B0A50_08618 [Salinomyces thailandicus]|uniref:Uncharacterized protein n=1 Tax=Salinomyces thailandicus TaxID=706561 RepID=A0A4U0TJM4_9PEZI|nr:hypothetical protein B0A50_08618 [Salinomyces thailandica]
MSASVFGINTTEPHVGVYTGFAGIKGPHPRMEYCCNHGIVYRPPGLPPQQIALAGDNCSQYCSLFVTLNAWLYCLTEEGDSVVNAFNVFDGRTVFETSGSLPRNGAFDPDSRDIKDYRRHSAGSRPSARKLLSLALALVTSTTIAFA